MPPKHPKGRVAAYERYLKRCGAPQEVISDFLDIVEIDNQIASDRDGGLESLDEFFLNSCAKFNFAVPFDSEHGKAWFRPNQINADHPDHRDDIWGSGGDFSPHEEQAYRRGYQQGFAVALRVTKSQNIEFAEKELGAISNWRHSKIWYGATRPGIVEPFGLRVSVRSAVSPKIRWAVLNRDKNRCVACGSGPNEGATLHVDHIVSLYNGGTNEVSNLQTLCAPCNFGKGKD